MITTEIFFCGWDPGDCFSDCAFKSAWFFIYSCTIGITMTRVVVSSSMHASSAPDCLTVFNSSARLIVPETLNDIKTKSGRCVKKLAAFQSGGMYRFTIGVEITRRHSKTASRLYTDKHALRIRPTIPEQARSGPPNPKQHRSPCGREHALTILKPSETTITVSPEENMQREPEFDCRCASHTT